MRLLGLDIGERRVGVAVSDPAGRVATPLKVLPGPISADVRALVRIIDDYEPGLIVIGLPLSMDGSEGPQAALVRQEGTRLAEMLSVPITYCDERLSSVAAQRAMADAGADSRARRGSVDMVAAAIMLQTYLDANQERPHD
ncbi:MAG: Holliday junction resolvase RuvX [Actinobacteria bacterium HGW-Actinobacteria-10]|nr:MAG: Holliday junction resolvase RuvX [Actinobacteria bacterium HGW-Actinobacteria-10]